MTTTTNSNSQQATTNNSTSGSGSSTRQTLLCVLVAVVLVLFITAPDPSALGGISAFSSFWDDSGRTSSFVKGVVFILDQRGQHTAEQQQQQKQRHRKEQEENDDNSNQHHHFVFAAQRCLARVGKELLPHLLLRENPSALQFAARQLSADRFKILNQPAVDIDLQHEHWVVRPWLNFERVFSTYATVIRAAGACLGGGGLGMDKPHSESHWAERAGRVNEHPFFFPLHGGVSPRRVVRHSLRSAEYLGIPTSALRTADAYLLSMMKMPKELDFSVFSLYHSSSLSGIAGGVLKRLMIHDDDEHRRNGAFHHNHNDNIKLKQQASGDSSFSRFLVAVSADEDAQQRQSQQVDEGNSISLELDSSNAGDSRTRTKVVVDLGGGHGAMLASICPPHPKLWCYGVDFTDALVQRALRAFPHIDFRTGTSAPHLPTGSADAILSNGVAGASTLKKFCGCCGRGAESR